MAVRRFRTDRRRVGLLFARWLFLFAAGGICITMTAAAQRPSAPCTADANRAFDFWIGEWNVRTPDGELAGTNSITRSLGGCVLHEDYRTDRGFRGESLNMYDALSQRWHQTWVDSSGLLLLLEGGLEGDSMVLEGERSGADGKATRHRITWTPGPDGGVRQLWESSLPDGEWSVVFDGRYTRQ